MNRTDIKVTRTEKSPNLDIYNAPINDRTIGNSFRDLKPGDMDLASLCSESGLDPIRHVIIEILDDVRIRPARASGARADAMSRSFDRNEILVDALRLAQKVLAVAHEVVRAHVGYQQRLGDHSQRAWRGVIAGAPINLVVVQ